LDVIETLNLDDEKLFKEKINELVKDGYSILFLNTIMNSQNKIEWIAVLKNSKKGVVNCILKI